MTARLGRAGTALALLYAVVAIATNALSSRPVRPLFDGFAPPVLYNWVNPPPERSGDNTVPQPAEREFALGDEGIEATNASSDDAQVIVGLDKGSVPSKPPDTGVKVRLSPFDAGTLGPLPAGLRPVGNAYRVALDYLPSQTEIPQLSKNGTIALTAAEPPDKLLYSQDGSRWQERAFQPYGQDNGLFTELEATGYFLAASSRPAAHTARRDVSRRVVLLGIAAVVPIAGAVLVLRLPSPVPARAGGGVRRPPDGRPRPPVKKNVGRGGKRSGKRRKR